MTNDHDTRQPEAVTRQRAAAKRTAIVLGLVALGVHVAFLLSGMAGQLGS